MKKTLLITAITLAGFSAQGQAPAAIPYTFAPNTPAKAAQVNDNFAALLQATHTLSTLYQQQQATITQLTTDLAAAQAAITALQNSGGSTSLSTRVDNLETFQTSATADITALETHIVEGLSDFVQVTTDAKGYDLIRFTGVNVQIRNKTSGSSWDNNGVGNLIIGQNEPAYTDFCSDGDINTTHANTVSEQVNCESIHYNHNGTQITPGTWGQNQRSGSHNLIIGSANDYTDAGALVVGFRNISNNRVASVLAGAINLASGKQSAIVAGSSNNTTGSQSGIMAGNSNESKGGESFIGGGQLNTASGSRSSIGGGSSVTNSTTSTFSAQGTITAP